MWDPQFEVIPVGFQFVRLDLRGFGHTSVPKERYTDCEDVLAVMDHLEIDRAVMVGCSMGAEVVLDLVALCRIPAGPDSADRRLSAGLRLSFV